MIKRSEKHPRRGATPEICKQVVNTIRIEPMGLRSQIWASQDTFELRATDRQGSRESAVGVQVRGGTWTKCLYARVVRRLRPREAEVSGAANRWIKSRWRTQRLGCGARRSPRPAARSAARCR